MPTAENNLDHYGEAYYNGVIRAAQNSEDARVKGQEDTARDAARNFQKAMQVMRYVERRHTYLRHKAIVKNAIGQRSGATTGQVYNDYCQLARSDDKEPRTYRRVTQLLTELVEEGEVTATEANRGKRGRTRYWEVV